MKLFSVFQGGGDGHRSNLQLNLQKLHTPSKIIIHRFCNETCFCTTIIRFFLKDYMDLHTFPTDNQCHIGIQVTVYTLYSMKAYLATLVNQTVKKKLYNYLKSQDVNKQIYRCHWSYFNSDKFLTFF